MKANSIPNKVGNLQRIKVTAIVQVDGSRVIDDTMDEFDLGNPNGFEVGLYATVTFDNWNSYVVILDNRFCPTEYWMWVPDEYIYAAKGGNEFGGPPACRYILHPYDWREFTPNEMKLVQTARDTHLQCGLATECHYEDDQLVTIL